MARACQHVCVSVVNNLPPLTTYQTLVGRELSRHLLRGPSLSLGAAESHYLRFFSARWNCFADRGFCRMWMAPPPTPLHPSHPPCLPLPPSHPASLPPAHPRREGCAVGGWRGAGDRRRGRGGGEQVTGCTSCGAAGACFGRMWHVLQSWRWGVCPAKIGKSHIDASLSRQPLVKGERLVRYEVNAVIIPHRVHTLLTCT